MITWILALFDCYNQKLSIKVLTSRKIKEKVKWINMINC